MKTPKPDTKPSTYAVVGQRPEPTSAPEFFAGWAAETTASGVLLMDGGSRPTWTKDPAKADLMRFREADAEVKLIAAADGERALGVVKLHKVGR